VDPRAAPVANDLACLYLEHGGDLNAALSLAQQAKQRMPDSPEISDTLGWAYYKLGFPTSAVAPLQEAAEKKPEDPECQYHLGMALVAAGQPDAGSCALRQALRADPAFAEAAIAKQVLHKVNGPLH